MYLLACFHVWKASMTDVYNVFRTYCKSEYVYNVFRTYCKSGHVYKLIL